MNTTKQHTVSVIICAYTEARWSELFAAVASLRIQSTLPREVIVVIDHNPSLLRRACDELVNVVVIENKYAQGLSGARNSGLAIAQGEFVAFLDDDATAEPKWLEYLMRACADPLVLGAGGMVLPRWLDGCPEWFPKEFYWVIGCSYRSLPASLMPVRNPYGGCSCMRREIFTAVGGFREDIGRVGKIPLGGEETELAIRAKQRWPEKIFLYVPEARIHHSVPPQRTRWRYFSARCYSEGLSKALIARYVGTKDGLMSERHYIVSDLAQGIIRNIVRGLWQRDRASFLRAGAIIAGLLITASGYFVGTLIGTLNAHSEIADAPSIEAVPRIKDEVVLP